MRIIYGRDYYDSALAWGRDTDIVFVREKNKTILLPYFGSLGFRELLTSLHPSVTIDPNGFTTRTTSYKLIPVIVYFCGKRYNGIKVESSSYGETNSTTYWNYDSYYNFLRSKNVDSRGHYDSSQTIKYYFDREISKKELDFLIENKYTILISQWNINLYSNKDEELWSVNAPELKKIHFYKVVDAYTAFQEISMWVGGVLTGQGKPMVQISDKYKIMKHGFDEWSFRKLSQGKK